MLLKNQLKAEIPATLTVTGQGSSFKINVTYFNRSTSEVGAMFEDSERKIGDIILYIVKEWDIEDFPLTLDGLVAAEDQAPGLIMAIIDGWHQARKIAKAKN